MTAPVRRLVAGDMSFGHGFGNIATGSEAALQRLKCELRLILGEWFRDATAGTPWFQVEGGDTKPIAGVAPRDIPYTEAVLIAKILSVDGIATLTDLTFAFEPNTRRLTAKASGTTVDGTAFAVVFSSP